MKVCTECGDKKEDILFVKNSFVCKVCRALYAKKYRGANKEKLKEKSRIIYQNNKVELKKRSSATYQKRKNTPEFKAQQKAYREKNKIKIKEQAKEYRRVNAEKIASGKRKYYFANKTKIQAYKKKYSKDPKNKARRSENHKNRYKNDIEYKMRRIFSSMIWRCLKNNNSSKNNQSCVPYLQYTVQQFINHIESLFDPWMNWNNYGKYNLATHDKNPTWTLDHIIPQSDLPFKTMEEDNFKKCFALSNLRPYCAKQNSVDGATMIRHKNKIKKCRKIKNKI